MGFYLSCPPIYRALAFEGRWLYNSSVKLKLFLISLFFTLFSLSSVTNILAVELDEEVESVAPEKKEYYLTPIKGLLSNDKGEFYSELINQGYEAHCSVPKISIIGDVSMDAAVRQILAATDGVLLEVDSQQNYDLSDAHIPLIRDQDQKATLFSSIEDYWGYKDTKETDPIAQKIASAPIYSLTPLLQQCVFQKKMLETIEAMCSKLTEPATCALDTPIPAPSYSSEESEYTSLELLATLRQNPDLTCTKIANHYSELSEQEKKLADNLSNVPLYLDKAYRLAFLVLSAETKGETPSTGWNFLRAFTAGNETPNQPSHEVRVLAFRIPDTTTNRDYLSDIFYKDSLQLTRDVLLTNAQIEDIKKEALAKRELDTLPGSTTKINCSGSEYCKNQVVSALVDFVNFRTEDESLCSANPDNLAYEDGGESTNGIFDSADINPSSGTIHNLDNQSGDVIEALGENQIDTKLPEDGNDNLAFKFLSVFNVSNWAKGTQGFSDTNIEGFLIIPQGTELASVENALGGLIYTQKELDNLIAKSAQDQSIDEYDYANYFKISNAGQGFDSTTAKTGTYQVITCLDPNDLTTCETQEKNAEAKNMVVTDQDANPNEKDLEPRIFGAKLGFFMRKIQQSLHNIGSETWNFIASTETTEEYLKGIKGNALDYQTQVLTCTQKCQEDFDKDSSQYISCIESCELENENRCLDVWVTQEQAQDYASELLANLPDQAHRSSAFAGWDNYYSGYLPDGKQYLFEPVCGTSNSLCYEYIIYNTLATKGPKGTLNPYLTVAISLNESGGLKSEDTQNYTGPHFGCGVDIESGDYSLTSAGTIENKFSCMVGFFNSHQNDSDMETLGSASDGYNMGYGYYRGEKNNNLNNLIDYLSYGSYSGECSN